MYVIQSVKTHVRKQMFVKRGGEMGNIFFILQVILVVVGGAVVIFNIYRNKNQKVGLINESSLYKSLIDEFLSSKDARGFQYSFRKNYTDIVNNANIEEIEHAISVLSSKLEVLSLDGMIIGLMPAVISIILKIYSAGFALTDKKYVVILEGITNIVALLIFFLIWQTLMEEYAQSRRQKFFLEILEMERERRKSEDGLKIERIENKIRQLDDEIMELNYKLKREKSDKANKSVTRKGLHMHVYWDEGGTR